jgi:hypothetical protein
MFFERIQNTAKDKIALKYEGQCYTYSELFKPKEIFF